MSPDSHVIVLSPCGSSTRSVTIGVAATAPCASGAAAVRDVPAARCRSVCSAMAQKALRFGLRRPCNTDPRQGWPLLWLTPLHSCDEQLNVDIARC